MCEPKLSPGARSPDAPTPKYALPEIERRWLADLDAAPALSGLPAWIIEDLYLEGSRLRVRAMIDSEGRGPTLFKLAKKYGSRGSYTEPMTNLYLDADEHALLSRLPGASVRKRRYRVAGGSLDVYEGAHAGTVIFEREFPDEAAARAYAPPAFALRELSGDSAFSGAALARAEGPGRLEDNHRDPRDRSTADASTPGG